MKLKALGCSLTAFQWFHPYLPGRSQRMFYIEFVLSKKICITKGVQQGLYLGPKLFSVFINDLPQVLKYSILFRYADDTSLRQWQNCYEIQGKLQEDLNRVVN